nr:uncharacterized protein LOC109147628 [Ipomoea batatas]
MKAKKQTILELVTVRFMNTSFDMSERKKEKEAASASSTGRDTPDDRAIRLICNCKHLAKVFNFIRFSHVLKLREGNKCANYLTNLGQIMEWATTIVAELREDLLTLLGRC